MAKLSARGRTELARFEKSFASSTDSLDQGATETLTVALMSDGHVLQKWKLTGGRWKDRPLKKNWRLLTAKWSDTYKTLQEAVTDFESKGWRKV